MIIRPAAKEDCEKVEKLSEIEELKSSDGSFIPASYFKSHIDDDKMFLVAEEDNKVIGYILGEPLKGHVALLGLLAVDKEYRGKSIGKKLVRSFRKRCEELGLTYIFFYAPSFNKDTIEFYKKQGFIAGKEYICFSESMEKLK